MIEKKFIAIFQVINRLNELSQISIGPLARGLNEKSPLTDEDRLRLGELSARVLKPFKDMEIDYPCHLIETKILPALKKNCSTTYEEMDILCKQLQDSYRYEMKRATCLIVPASKTAYFDQNVVFDQSVWDKFPISYEIEESLYCFGLERYSASVFHLMRILEAGLNELAKKFNVNFANANWGKVINEIQKAVKDISLASHGNDWKRIQNNYSEICTHFRFLKDSWRNYAMHLHGQYGEEHAKKIMDNVASFMKDLAALI